LVRRGWIAGGNPLGNPLKTLAITGV